MYLNINFKDTASVIYSSIEELHPAIKCISVVALIALAVWKFSLKKPVERLDKLCSWRLIEKRLKGDEKFLKILKSIYTLDIPKVLNTNLEQQPSPHCFLIGMNRLAIACGFKDKFAKIRASNVLKKIKEFIQNNQDNIFLNREQNIHLIFSDSLKERLGTKYSKQIQDIEELAKLLSSKEVRQPKNLEIPELPLEEETKNPPQTRDQSKKQEKKTEQTQKTKEPVKATSWKEVAQLQNSEIAKLPFVEEITKAARNGDEEAFSLLQKAAKIQTTQVEEAEIRNKSMLYMYRELMIFNFQTEPLKNAFIQLSLCYFQRDEKEKAKEMIFNAFQETNVDIKNWKGAIDEKFYQFFQISCFNLGVQILNEITQKNYRELLVSRLIVAAKELILEKAPQKSAFLAGFLANLSRTDEALECYRIAIQNCEKKDLAKIYSDVIFLFKTKNDPASAIEWAKQLFPIDPDDLSKLSQEEKFVWDSYKHALKCLREGKEFSKNPFGEFL